MTKILGISAFYHDSAAVLLIDGEIAGAAQEERFTRVKHDHRFPRHAVQDILNQNKISVEDIDLVVFHEKPLRKFHRIIMSYLANSPQGLPSFRAAMTSWMNGKISQRNSLSRELRNSAGPYDIKKIRFSEHHLSHAASAFYPSPFDEALVLTMDGVGEWATTSVAIGRRQELKIVREIHFPHSLGLLYSTFTQYLGFRVNSGEYKVMGLAPYGTPRFKELILSEVIDVKPDGSFFLNMKYFDYVSGLKMHSSLLPKLFGRAARKPDQDPLEIFHMDVASSLQAVIEDVTLRLTSSLAKEYGIRNLCMAGGVALNCVANGKILRSKAFDNVWVQPAAGDAGGALGAAYAVWHKECRMPRLPLKAGAADAMRGSYLGTEFSQERIEQALIHCGARFRSLEDEELLRQTAAALAEGKAVGWFQGRMEFGPRALGARSILADPRSADMQKLLNLKIKFRESFRPFAPAVLAEDASAWFEVDGASPYMLIVANVLPEHRRPMTDEEKGLFGIEKLNVRRSSVPAVTHVDYSARVQTVHEETNPRFYALLRQFKEITGCPMLVNTSFNVRGEPIVCSPEDAYHCFMGTGLDMLVCGNSIAEKSEQDSSNAEDYTSRYTLD